MKTKGGIIHWRCNEANEFEYLMLKNSKFQRTWTPSKGDMDKDDHDNVKRTAVRETHEETGLTNNIHYEIDDNFMHYTQYYLEGVYVNCTYFLGMLVDSNEPNIKLQIEEVSEYKWCTLNEMQRDKNMKQKIVYLYEKAEKYLNEKFN